MNLKQILRSSIDIEKRYWVFVQGIRQIPRFVAVKNKYGPEIFTLIVVQKNQETVITNNYVYIRTINNNGIYEECKEVIGKEYTLEEYFNNTSIYDLPTPQELKEIRKYFKKNHKNHQLTAYIGKKSK